MLPDDIKMTMDHYNAKHSSTTYAQYQSVDVQDADAPHVSPDGKPVAQRRFLTFCAGRQPFDTRQAQMIEEVRGCLPQVADTCMLNVSAVVLAAFPGTPHDEVEGAKVRTLQSRSSSCSDNCKPTSNLSGIR